MDYSNWFDDLYIGNSNDELNQFDENSQRAFWDDVIDITTNIPGVLDEDGFASSSREATQYVNDNGGTFDSFGLSGASVQNSIVPDTVENIYDKIFENLEEDDQTKEAEPSEAIVTKLYPHQKQALSWMIGKENKKTLPPFWKQKYGYYINTITNERREKVDGVHGGILADDMGLGKTLVMISLILTNFVEEKPLAYPLRGSGNVPFTFTEQKKLRKKDGCQSKPTCTHHSSSALKSTTDSVLEKNISTSSSQVSSQQGYNGAGSSERAVKRLNIQDEQEMYSAAKYAKLPEHDCVNTPCTERYIIDPDSVIDISDCDSVITIYDSDEEESNNPKPSSSKEDTAHQEDFGNPKPSCSKEDTVDQEELSNPKPSCSKEDTVYHREVFQGYDSITGRCRTSGPRGTLIICPTSVLHNWQDQFQQHVDKTVHLKIYIHYGKNRSLDVKFIKEQDVVITTYHTMIADYKKQDKGPIYNTEWLRIVLDEGHEIRNPKTGTAKIIFQLTAHRRWVLTGTPIQNTLEDLWSIINFLKVEPLTDKRCWNRTIAYPVAAKKASAMKPVFHLMKNLALRRTKTQQLNGKSVLDLPARNVVLKKLTLSLEQREAYDRLEREGKILIRQYIEDNTVQAHRFEIYVTQLRLRQFCCHPKLACKANANNSATLTTNNHLNYNETYEEDGSALNDLCAVCQICFNSPKNAVVASSGNVYCWTCIQINSVPDPLQAHPLTEQGEMSVAEMRKLMEQLTPAKNENEECIICTNGLQDAVVTSRGHVYCRACFENNPVITQAYESISTSERKQLLGKLLSWLDSDEEFSECPICYTKSMEIGPREAVITFCGHQFCWKCIQKLCMTQVQPLCPICRKELDKNKLIKVPQKLTEGSGVFNLDDWKSGAKLDALMTALAELKQKDPSIKSIVVSQFTSLLDLIEKALREKGFVFTRLDGKMTQNKRLHAIRTFSDKREGSPTVFLLSLKAGGVGINLTAASRVFLMDPAWNPAAEEQCFDRCHRLGQTRDVEIIKFIIENSVEENMLKLQDRKRGLMTEAFSKKLTKEQRAANYINDLIDFFQIFD